MRFSNTFGGLERNLLGDNTSLLDGGVGSKTWFYAVGYGGNNWEGKGLSIPAMNGYGTAEAELFVRKPES